MSHELSSGVRVRMPLDGWGASYQLPARRCPTRRNPLLRFRRVRRPLTPDPVRDDGIYLLEGGAPDKMTQLVRNIEAHRCNVQRTVLHIAVLR